MVSSFVWGEGHDSLLALADGAALLWLWPHAASADPQLTAAARVTLAGPAFSAPGQLSQLLAYAGSRAVLQRGDGAVVHATVSPFAAPLHAAATAGRWEEAISLARVARSGAVWAALTSLALAARQLDAAEIALAAAGAIDKLQFLRHIKAQVRAWEGRSVARGVPGKLPSPH